MCGDRIDKLFQQYGDIGNEVCIICWLKFGGDSDAIPESWYGLAPHKHAYDENGNVVIGGTEMLPLPERNEYGEYIIDGLIFTPDDSTPGMGYWSKK